MAKQTGDNIYIITSGGVSIHDMAAKTDINTTVREHSSAGPETIKASPAVRTWGVRASRWAGREISHGANTEPEV